MAAVCAGDIGKRFVDALGLSDGRVRSIRINANAGERLTAEVTMLLSTDQAGEVLKILEAHEWTEREEASHAESNPSTESVKEADPSREPRPESR
jgi:hypothetical protein